MPKKSRVKKKVTGMDQYSITRQIGNGSFGRVFQATHLTKNIDFAVKKVCCSAPENVELALQEFWTLSRLPEHINIIRFEECFLQQSQNIGIMSHGDKTSIPYLSLVEMAIKGKRNVQQTQAFLYFVMEYCDSGDLNDFLLDREPNADLNGICMLQLAEGIAFLHKNNVAHRDLKPENILVHSFTPDNIGPVLKIADFGLSKVCTKFIDHDSVNQLEADLNIDSCWLSSACGSDFFMAPEVFEGRYTAKADVFAMGVMFWAIMDRITFIDAETKKTLLGTYVTKGNAVLPVGEVLLDDPKLDLSELLKESGSIIETNRRGNKTFKAHTCVSANIKQLRNLVVEMLLPNPDARPNSQELLIKLRKIVKPHKRPLKLLLKNTQEVLEDEKLKLPRERICDNNKHKHKMRRRKRKTSNVSPIVENAADIHETEKAMVPCKPEIKTPSNPFDSAIKSPVTLKEEPGNEENKLSIIPIKKNHLSSDNGNKSKNGVLNDIKNCGENIRQPVHESASKCVPNKVPNEMVQTDSEKCKKKTCMRKYAALPVQQSHVHTKEISCKNKDNTGKKSYEVIENEVQDFPFSMPMSPTGRRRHNGLKAQICQFKNPTSRVQTPVNRNKNISPTSSEECKSSLSNSLEKVEVPKTPCVVTVSKVKHHPLLPMKKRWRKYMLLSNTNDDHISNHASTSEVNKTKSELKVNTVKPDDNLSHQQKLPNKCKSGSSGVIMHAFNPQNSSTVDSRCSMPAFAKEHLPTYQSYESNEKLHTYPRFKRKLSYSEIANMPCKKKFLPDPPKLIPIRPVRNEVTPRKSIFTTPKKRYKNSATLNMHSPQESAWLQNLSSPCDIERHNKPYSSLSNVVVPPQGIFLYPRKSNSVAQNQQYNHVILPSHGMQSVNNIYEFQSIPYRNQYPKRQNVMFNSGPSTFYGNGISTRSSLDVSKFSPESVVAAKQHYYRQCAEEASSPQHQRIPNIYFSPSQLRTPSF